MNSSSKYFNGKCGVYYERSRDEILLLKQVESYGLFNQKTNTFRTIPRYNVEYENSLVNKIAVVANKDLIRIGDL